MSQNYKEINKNSWNKRTIIHWDSEFYDNKSFLAGKNSLRGVEQKLLGDIRGKTILHLQCHFGQDTISMSRMGAETVGVDLSDVAIEKAERLNQTLGQQAQFICCDIYDLPKYLDRNFDIVFTSYGTIGWLPDMNRWADLISSYLNPGGKFVFVEFHPAVWMYDDDFKGISYDYFNTGPIEEIEEGTYTDGGEAMGELQYVMWNHGIGEVTTSLLRTGLRIDSLQEYDYSPYNCFKNMIEIAPDKYRIASLEKLFPMVYSITATKL